MNKQSDIDNYDPGDKEKYVEWEPENLVEKVTSIWQNTIEIWFVVAVGVFGLIFPSMLAAGFFLVSNLLMFSMTMNLTRRKFWGLVFTGVIAFLLLSEIIWKVRKINTMIPSTDDYDTFKSEIRFYESLGFKLDYHESAYEGTPNSDGQYTYSVSMAYSFGFEAFLVVMMLTFIEFLYDIHKRYSHLTHEKTIRNLNILAKYMTEKHEREEEEMQNGEMSALATGNKNRDEIDKEKEKERELENEMNEIKKGVKKIFLNSDHFFSFNQVFFVLLILFTLLQAMMFNSCSDIPSLFMLLVMFATYALRKNFTTQFLKYTFFVVYFIQGVMTLKLINATCLNVLFVKDFIVENKDAPFVIVNNLIFGSIQTTGSSSITLQQIGYYANIFICLFACQAWKCSKWIEIRFKSRHLAD